MQAGERGDDMRDSGRMCVSGEVRVNEGARAMRVGARERGRRQWRVRVCRTRVKEGGWMGEGVTTHNDHHALSFHESAWWSWHAVFMMVGARWQGQGEGEGEGGDKIERTWGVRVG